MLTNPIESGLVVLIPEAENLVESFRQQFDPSNAVSVPAHVTILYPFKSPDQLTDKIIATLRELFLKMPGFTSSFSSIQHFPNGLFLAPEPVEPFCQLTEAVVKVFPETPPYGGAFQEIIPHLTIAQVSDLQQLDEISANFSEVAKGKLPIIAKVDTVSLMENSSGNWKTRAQFSLRTGSQAG
jgi:2'-5' RNA ligase